MAGKSRELSWSLSKARMFQECPRRFYYQYYFSKFGYAPDAPEEARLASEMASIKGLDMWAGEIVHQTVQWALESAKDGVMPAVAQAREAARQRLSEGWRYSVKQLWRQQRDDLHPNLFEHYYKIPIGPTAIDRIKNKTFASVSNFIESSLFNHITHSPLTSWLPIEKYSSFRIDGILFYVRLDFAMRENNSIQVYDWKTGKPTPEEDRQLACYALYTSSRWEIPLENVQAYAVHLQPALDMKESSVGEDEIDDLRAYVKRSFNSMVRCLQNPERNIAAMDDFPMTGNLPRCTRCSFRGICSQGMQANGEIENLSVADDWWG